MDPQERRRLAEAVEQARLRAALAVRNLEAEETSPKSAENAIREAEAELKKLGESLQADD